MDISTPALHDDEHDKARTRIAVSDSGTMNRRQLLRAVGLLAGAIGVDPAFTRAASTRVVITPARGVKVHTYTAPDKGWQVTTQIIETPSQLIVVDGQYLLPYAREAAAFCHSLNKPISRLYITHFHPDHHLGAEAFGAPCYALPEVRAKITAIGDRLANEERAKFPSEPNVIPAHAIKPDFDVTPGTDVVDGVRIDFRVVRHAEADPSLAIILPDASILIAQDLVYNRVHLFLGEKSFDGWTAALEEYRALGLRHILPGHGVPTGPKVYADMLGYLRFARQTLSQATDGPTFAHTMIQQYPDYGGRALLEHEQRFLFPKN